jgi:hypothetical protein
MQNTLPIHLSHVQHSHVQYMGPQSRRCSACGFCSSLPVYNTVGGVCGGTGEVQLCASVAVVSEQRTAQLKLVGRSRTELQHLC